MNDKGFALYVHWPFCLKKCPYCDFHSRVSAGIDHREWQELLLFQLGYFARFSEGRRLDSIFFGGGTPSLMPDSTIRAIVDQAGRHWPFAPDIEISLEANPGEWPRLPAIKDCGINRISLGIQALNDQDLAFLGRRHDLKTAHKAIDTALGLFERVSLDFIYARPGQSPAAWQEELEAIIRLGARHLSLYQLTIAPETPFAEKAIPEAPEDLAIELYDLTRAETLKAGLPLYEVSNHAEPGQECRHNLIYWQGGDYIGIGPSAHGRYSHAGQFWASFCPLDQKIPEITPLSPKEKAWERILMGLRLQKGLDITGLEEFLSLSAIAELETQGLLELNGNRLKASDVGLLCLNRITAEIL